MDKIIDKLKFLGVPIIFGALLYCEIFVIKKDGILHDFLSNDIISLVSLMWTVSLVATASFYTKASEIAKLHEFSDEQKSGLFAILEIAKEKLIYMTVIFFAIIAFTFLPDIIYKQFCIFSYFTPFVIVLVYWFFLIMIDLFFAQLDLIEGDISIH